MKIGEDFKEVFETQQINQINKEIENQPPQKIQKTRKKFDLAIFKTVSVILLTLILITAGTYLYIYVENKTINTKDSIDMIKYLKCLSLCRTIPITINQTTTIQDHAPSCDFYCQDELSNLKEDKSTFFNENLRMKYILEEFTYCRNKMKTDQSFNYESCYKKVFENTTDIYDVSDYDLKKYTEYDIVITDFICRDNETSMRLNYKRGDSKAKNITITITNGTNYLLEQTTPPRVEKIKSIYVIFSNEDKAITNVTTVEVSLEIDNFKVDTERLFC